MFCKNCGKEISDKAVICTGCGTPTGVEFNPNPNAGGAPDVMTGGLVALCILIPIVGLIVGIVKQSSGARVSGSKCIKYSLIAFFIYLFIEIIVFSSIM